MCLSSHQSTGPKSFYHQNDFISWYKDAFLLQGFGEDQLQSIHTDFISPGCLGRKVSKASLPKVLKIQMLIYPFLFSKAPNSHKSACKTNTKRFKMTSSRVRALYAFSHLALTTTLRNSYCSLAPLYGEGEWNP